MSFNLPLIKTEFKVDVLIDTVLIPEKFFYNKVISLENNKIIGEFAVLIDSVELFLKNKREKVIKDSLGFENDSIICCLIFYFFYDTQPSQILNYLFHTISRYICVKWIVQEQTLATNLMNYFLSPINGWDTIVIVSGV